MGSSVHAVWAIDIGSNALKALRFVHGDEGIEVIGFDYVEHSRILSGEGVTPEQKEAIIADTLHVFASRNEVDKDEVGISVAGHNSFARFIKLPPVEPKRIPEIVQFEAVQQIPFDINEVEWDWQLMENPDSPDTEVGIFAVKNELIGVMMDNFADEDMQVRCVQISPLALHNYVNYDRNDIGSPREKATIILDMGAENTTLIVSTNSTVWQRSIRIGGNAFTEAICDTFNVSFQKAEKLKRKALMSKYVRQLFSAMKPVYTDLGSEIQRSLGFYTSSGQGRDKGFARIIAIGGGMKLKGVAKYLQQTLGIPVEKLDSFKNLKLAEGQSAAKFHENAADYAIAYGLGVQMLEEPAIKSNLLPRKIARAMAWARKARIFTFAASILFLVALLGLARAAFDNTRYSGANSERTYYKRIIGQAQSIDSNYETQVSRESELAGRVAKQFTYFGYKDVIPKLAEAILTCLPNSENDPDTAQKQMHKAFKAGDVKSVKDMPRSQRRQLIVTSLMIDYTPLISEGTFRAVSVSTSRTSVRRFGGYGDSDDDDYYEDDGFDGFGFDGYGGPASMGPGGLPGSSPTGGSVVEEVVDGPGFVVTIEGYSPYIKIGDLLDPPLVGKNKDKWGLVTRFENLGDIIENCPFELYTKSDTEHFRQEFGEVELNVSTVPAGIGEIKEMIRVAPDEDTLQAGARSSYGRYGGSRGVGGASEKVTAEMVLVDPMTKEEMSKTFDFVTQQDIDDDPQKDIDDLGMKKFDLNGEPEYIVRDHWFRINVKFLWKEDPTVSKTDTNAIDEY